ncbi:SDR family NAD(P)-dependent oxidoreductase [Plantactinospora sp. KLBMP9567]|uniref:SDR family NAD(P)-dependent oxidoreductase n=1 Tax=Plantactinospora sp. KLBMP9567 TaxID=3085900 RepID=UPI0029825B5A|nr:SDR family NAD(P)-dependent oxidoreductase [Plantactinospora sp. KLBMP9567]MDW5324319.1 SDR family NAD(P)-dependent oxidoreductase [Plantactinospora sp. KLBMP9567]
MPSPQRPIGSGFGAASTAGEVIEGIDLSGRTAIVTGGHSGLGLETTRALRSAGATVVVPVRSPDRARDMLAGIDGVEIDQLDLMDRASIDAFADRFLATGRPLHILVNSAGIQNVPLTRDARGYEAQFATNHLGHFQLATRLWPALRRAPGARVVTVSAWAHNLSPVVFDDPNFERREYDGWLGYGQSKTANILFTVGLDQRGEADDIRGFSLHPGLIIGTNLSPWTTPEYLRTNDLVDEHGNRVIDPESGRKTAEQGASTIVWCATAPQLDGMGGVYCENNEISPLLTSHEETIDVMTGRVETAVGVRSYAVAPQLADRLWNLSERLTNSKIQ